MKTDEELLDEYLEVNDLHPSKYLDDQATIEYRSSMSKTLGFNLYADTYKFKFHFSQLSREIAILIQKITGFHYIHHLQYSYGWKVPFIDYGVFPEYDRRRKNRLNKKLFKKLGRDLDGNKKYHNCTTTGIS